MLAIGIDPGTHTGYAVWDMAARKLVRVDCMLIHEAMELVASVGRSGELHTVAFEDARQRTWFAGSGREKLQGAGSIKRDCQIWADYLASLGVNVRPVKPAKGATKWDAKRFAKVTGWTGRTNEHGRDAALLVFGL